MVTTFYKRQLAQKTLTHFYRQARFERELRSKMFVKLQRERLSKLVFAWRRISSKLQISPQESGPALFAAKLWLEKSFGLMMEKVWREFPAQKIEIDSTTGQYLPLANYLMLSKQQKHHQHFFKANARLR